MQLVSNIVIGIALLTMLCGMIGLLRSAGFYRRLLVASLVDTAGLLLLLLGLCLRAESVALSLKTLLLAGAILLTAPLVTHKLGRAAYLSGHREEEEEYDA